MKHAQTPDCWCRADKLLRLAEHPGPAARLQQAEADCKVVRFERAAVGVCHINTIAYIECSDYCLHGELNDIVVALVAKHGSHVLIAAQLNVLPGKSTTRLDRHSPAVMGAPGTNEVTGGARHRQGCPRLGDDNAFHNGLTFPWRFATYGPGRLD